MSLQHYPTEPDAEPLRPPSPEAEPPEPRSHPPGPIDARWDGTGIVAAAEGTVFGHVTVSINYRGRCVFEPSDCEECGGPRPVVVNYNHRICPSCYSIIATQLWRFLEGNVSERPAEVIWVFLLERDGFGGN